MSVCVCVGLYQMKALSLLQSVIVLYFQIRYFYLINLPYFYLGHTSKDMSVVEKYCSHCKHSHPLTLFLWLVTFAKQDIALKILKGN